MKVEQLSPNQMIIYTSEGTFFQSYDSIIAFKSIMGKIQLDVKFWDYSKTTRKYRNMFLNETKKETEAKISNGEYILTNLNK
jgi:hypothetical protein